MLITGGTGTLGRSVARHLAERHGISRLLLVSRQGPDAPGNAELLAELAKLSATATVVACDVADRNALAQLLARLPADRPLTGIVHAAGVLEDATIASLTPGQLSLAMRPKVDAAVNLHELTRDLRLSAFVSFSSAAGVLGSAGQGGYAAANAFLDALAQHRHASGLAGKSLAWGLWSQRSRLTAGLDEADIWRMARSGVGLLSAGEGLALFDAACALPGPLLVPVRLDLSTLRAEAGVESVPALLRGLVRARASHAGGARAAGQGLGERLAGLPAEERHRVLVSLVREHAAVVLGHAAPEAIDEKRGFLEAGFDSLTALELRNRLAGAASLRLPATLIFNHPTPHEVASYLGQRLFGDNQPAAVPGLPAVTPPGDRDAAIDQMDVENLVELALRAAAPNPTTDGGHDGRNQ